MESLVNEAAALFAGRRVLVTGAAGFVGRKLVSLLATAGAELSILDAPAADLSGILDLSSQVWPADICDPEAVRLCVQSGQPEYVFHLAAVGVTDPFLSLERALAVNLHGSLNLFQACFGGAPAAAPVKLVHTGTPYEYGAGRLAEPAPINPYAASKAAAFAVARMLQRTQNWPIVTVRPFQIYGPGQSEQALIPSAIHAALAGRPFRMTGGEQKRDLIFLDDVVRGCCWRPLSAGPGAVMTWAGASRCPCVT